MVRWKENNSSTPRSLVVNLAGSYRHRPARNDPGGPFLYPKGTTMLSKDEAAERLGVKRNFIDGLIKRGEIKFVKLGTRTVRIPESEIDRIIAGAA